MSNGLFGPGIGVYRPGNKVYPPNWTYEARAPNANDNQGYVIGDLWLDTSATPEPEPWVLVSLAGNSTSSGSLAHWIRFAGPDVNVNTLTGDDGVAVAPTAGNIDILATPTAGATVSFDAVALSTLGLKVTDAGLNTLIGLGAGGTAITTANTNTSLGYNSVHNIVNGTQSTFIGYASGFTATDAFNCTALGHQSLDSATAPENIIAIGSASGLAYATNEKSNIVIGNTGVIGENNTIRIGTQGTGAGEQNRFFAAGIDGVSVGNTANVVTEVGGQLGTAVITAGTGIALNLTPNVIEIEATGAVTGNPVAFCATENAETNVTGDGTLFHLGEAVPMNIVQNIGGGFYPGDGAGTPASFTAPVTGTYILTYFLASNITVGGGTPGGTDQGWYIDNGGSLLGVMNGPTGNKVAGFFGGGGFWDQSGSIVTPLTAGDVITWAFIAGNQSKTASTAAGVVSGALLGTLNNGGGANSFVTDAGAAAPLAGVLNVISTATSGASVEFTGSGNTVALNVTDSQSNTTVGLGSGGVAITTAEFNTCLGAQTGSGLTTGNNNIFIGTGVGSAITTGSGNFLCGDSATVPILAGTAAQNGLYAFGASNGAGGTPTSLFLHNYGGDQSGNTFVGYNAGSLAVGQSGNNLDNTGCGQSSLEDLTTGTNNAALGYQAGANLTSGVGSVFIGRDAGLNLLTGNYCILAGLGAGNGYGTNESNNIVLGNTAGTAGENNTMRLGNDGTLGGTTPTARAFAYGVRGATTGVNDAIAVLIDSAGQLGTVSSSLRFKDNVEDMGDESSAIMNLRPVKFNYKESSDLQTGLIAEEVFEVMPRLAVHNRDGQIESVKYHELPALLLNELQKLQKRVAELESKLN